MTRSPRSLLERSELIAPLTLVGAMVVIWAFSGFGYFWPMWVFFGLLFPTALVQVNRWATRHPDARYHSTPAHAMLTVAVVAAANVLIWLMTGVGYFWPMWLLIPLFITFTIWRTTRPPREEQLEARVDELTRTRAGAVDVQASELRRIERDLHDGAQARLVALSMQLGRAEERLAGKGADSGDLDLLRQARREATAAISELRDLAQGISPPVLADRGLEAAVQSLADRSGTHVQVIAEIPDRPPPAVENAAYFVVAESLTNAAKHAPGAAVRVTLWHEAGELGIVVADQGAGGADPTGSGLSGLRKRVEALDGWLEVLSPVGEGTTVRATLPCS